MDLTQLRHLTMVAARGSIGQAARELGLTQPGLSKSIRRLEQLMGATLVTRLPRGVHLTAEGQRLVEHAKVILLQAEDARKDVGALARGEVAELAIGAGPSWLSRHLPFAVARAVEDLPNLHVRIVGGFNDRLLASLERGELHMVVAALPDGGLPSHIKAMPLTHDDLEVVARADHPLARASVEAGALQGARWILPGREVASRVRLEALFHSQGLRPPEPVIESDSISFILATLRETDFLSFATKQLLSGDEGHGLAALRIPGFRVRRPAGVLFRDRGVRSKAALKVVEQLQQICVEHSQN